MQKKNLKGLSSGGTSRHVFAIDDKTVLKIARSERGRAQNRLESDWSLQSWHGNILTKLIDFDDENYNWVRVERAIPLKSVATLKKMFSGIDLYQIEKYLENRNPDITEEQRKFLDNDELVQEILMMTGNFNMPIGDILRPSSWGFVTRDGKQVPVLLDYGLNRRTLEKYYSK